MELGNLRIQLLRLTLINDMSLLGAEHMVVPNTFGVLLARKDKGNKATDRPTICNNKNYELVQETHLTTSQVYITYFLPFREGFTSTYRNNLLIY